MDVSKTLFQIYLETKEGETMGVQMEKGFFTFSKKSSKKIYRWHHCPLEP